MCRATRPKSHYSSCGLQLTYVDPPDPEPLTKAPKQKQKKKIARGIQTGDF